MDCCQPTCKVLIALLARLLFYGHGVLTFWIVAYGTENGPLILIMCLIVVFYIAEFILTCKFRKEYMEWKWISPSVALYLASVVPMVVLLEIDLLDQRQEFMKEQNLERCSDIELSKNATLSDSDFYGVQLQFSLTNEEWALVIEQTIPLLIILGRWMLPKGELTQDQLSDLLLIYVGTGADITEFIVDSISDDKVACNTTLVSITLGLWAWSLIQYTILLTARYDHFTHDEEDGFTCCKSCCKSGTWAECISLILQDLPFLGFRLYLMIKIRVISNAFIFFTGKNILVVLLQFYRIKNRYCCPNASDNRHGRNQQNATTEL